MFGSTRYPHFSLQGFISLEFFFVFDFFKPLLRVLYFKTDYWLTGESGKSDWLRRCNLNLSFESKLPERTHGFFVIIVET